MRDPPSPPLKDPSDRPIHDPAGDRTYKPQQPFGDPMSAPGRDPPLQNSQSGRRDVATPTRRSIPSDLRRCEEAVPLNAIQGEAAINMAPTNTMVAPKAYAVAKKKPRGGGPGVPGDPSAVPRKGSGRRLRNNNRGGDAKFGEFLPRGGSGSGSGTVATSPVGKIKLNTSIEMRALSTRCCSSATSSIESNMAPFATNLRQ
jgi:hypothetical protein